MRSRSQTSQDVTQQTVDVASRLATQKASIARVRALLARATKISDIILIEGELSNRESNLESLEAQLTSLNDSVDLATLTVTLTPAGAPTKPVEGRHRLPGRAGPRLVGLRGGPRRRPDRARARRSPSPRWSRSIGVPALLLYRRRRPAVAAIPATAAPSLDPGGLTSTRRPDQRRGQRSPDRSPHLPVAASRRANRFVAAARCNDRYLA